MAHVSLMHEFIMGKQEPKQHQQITGFRIKCSIKHCLYLMHGNFIDSDYLGGLEYKMGARALVKRQTLK